MNTEKITGFVLACMVIILTAAVGLSTYAWGSPDEEFITPHETWAKPYYRGTVKALVLSPSLSQREVLELEQRMDINCTTTEAVFHYDAIRLPEDPKQMEAASVTADILHKLKEDYNVIIIGELNWEKVFTAGIQYAILEKVSRGTGLVYISPRGVDETLKKVFEWEKISDGNNFCTAGIPFESVPGFEGMLKGNNIRLSKFKSGRIAAVSYPASRHMGLSNYYALAALTPEINCSPYRYRFWEYYYSFLAKVILWAADREPELVLSEIIPECGESGAGKISLNVTNNFRDWREFEACCSIRDTDDAENVRFTSHVTIPKGTEKISLDMPRLTKKGLHFADVIIKRNGAVINWGTVPVEIKREQGIAAITLNDGRITRDTGSVAGRALLSGGQGYAGYAARIELLTPDGRVTERKDYTLNSESRDVAFTLDISRAPVFSMIIRASLINNSELYDLENLDIALQRRTDAFTVVMWDVPNTFYLYRYILARLKDMGVDAVKSLPGTTAGNEIILQSCMRVIPTDGSVLNGLIPSSSGGTVRKPCLTSAEHKNAMEKRGMTRAAEYRKFEPLAYSVGDEIFLGRSNSDYCFSPTCLEGFREFLKSGYKTLDRLNSEWERTYSKWEDILPATYQEIKNSRNFAPWLDHRTYMESVFADAIVFAADSLKKEDADASVGICGTESPNSFNGMNFWKILQSIDMVESYSEAPLNMYDERGLQREYVRSFARKGMFLSAYSGYDPSDSDEIHARSAPWRLLFHEHNGISYFMSVCYPGSDVFPYLLPDLSLSRRAQWVREEMKDIKGGIADLLAHAQRENDGIAIFHSQTSIHAATITNSFSRWLNSQRGFTRTLEDMGLQYDFISSTQLLHNILQERNYKICILPYSISMSQEESLALRDWVAAGGILMADVTPGIMNEHGNPQNPGLFQDMFDRNAVKNCGHGKTVMTGTENLRTTMEKLGIQGRLLISEADGKRLSECEVTFFSEGNAEYAGFIKNASAEKQKNIPAVITFPKKAHVYDVRTGSYYGYTGKISTDVRDGFAKLYALLPYRVTGLTCKLNSETVAPGMDVTSKITVLTEGQPAGTHTVKREVYDPQGKVIPVYGAVMTAERGICSANFRLAFNECPGTWTLKIRDIASGAESATHFKVEIPREAQ